MPDLTQFFGLPSLGRERADVLVLPLPIEKTVCYGTGAASGPRAIVEATVQVETFDEETLVEFAESPRVHVLPPVPSDGDLEACLSRISNEVRALRGLRDKFLLCLGGEHSVTYGVLDGMVDDPAEVTIVQLDAHGDLADKLGGRHWSHGTVMRRLWERGCRLMQIGIRSMTRDEYDVATDSPRIATYFAHCIEEQWPEILDALRRPGGQGLSDGRRGRPRSVDHPQHRHAAAGRIVVAANDGNLPRAADRVALPTDRRRRRRVRRFAGSPRLRSRRRPTDNEAAGVVVEGPNRIIAVSSGGIQ